jgi:hypothetical protein
MNDGHYLFTIFCDDVRQEAGGKLSYMGVYGPQLIVRTFPATLPKLCFVITARAPVSEPFQHLRFRIMKDDEVIAQSEVIEGVQEAIARKRKREDDQIVSVVGIMQLSPLLLSAPCELRVRADTETGELLGGTLSIESTSIENQ